MKESTVGTVLHMVPDLGLNGAAAQASLLAPTLEKEGWRVHVVGLGSDCFFAPRFKRWDVPIHRLGSSHSLDFRPYLELRRLIEEIRPDIIQVWRNAALRLAAPIARWLGRPPLVASDVVGPTPPRWIERWTLQQTAVIVVPTATDQKALMLGGIEMEQIVSIPFAAGNAPLANRTTSLKNLRLPEDAKLIVC